MSGLTPKQAMFAAEYLVDANATRAAIAAGYSAKSAAVTGARLLKNPRIAEIIGARQKRRLELADVSADRTIMEVAKIAYHDPGAFFDEHGNLLPVAKLGEMERAALEGFEVEVKKLPGGERSVLKKVKKADRIRALELLGKYQKLWTDKLEHSGRMTLEQLVCGAPAPVGEVA